MQIDQIQSLLTSATTPTAAAAQPAPGFQSLASSLIALLSDDDSQTDTSNGLSALLGEDCPSTSSQGQLQAPPDSASALLLQAQLGL